MKKRIVGIFVCIIFIATLFLPSIQCIKNGCDLESTEPIQQKAFAHYV